LVDNAYIRTGAAMKTFKESTRDYDCTGCGTSIYNATKVYTTCPECGYKVKSVKEKRDER
jgi:predicted RNA-binding Zn-ribbon protein involved in translation (DUF1610 family)